MALPLDHGIATDEIVDAINSLHSSVQNLNGQGIDISNNDAIVELNSQVQWLVTSVTEINAAITALQNP